MATPVHFLATSCPPVGVRRPVIRQVFHQKDGLEYVECFAAVAARSRSPEGPSPCQMAAVLACLVTQLPSNALCDQLNHIQTICIMFCVQTCSRRAGGALLTPDQRKSVFLQNWGPDEPMHRAQAISKAWKGTKTNNMLLYAHCRLCRSPERRPERMPCVG